MLLTIKLNRNWNSFQLAISAPPLNVTDSAIAPSARMVHGSHGAATELKEDCSLRQHRGASFQNGVIEADRRRPSKRRCVSRDVRAWRQAAFRDVIIGKRPQAICRATNSAVDDSIGGS